MPANKATYKRKVDRRMHDFGDIDLEKKVIRVNPRKGDIVNTVIHEELHRRYPKKSEKWIKKKASQKEGSLTMGQAAELLKKYSYPRRRNA